MLAIGRTKENNIYGFFELSQKDVKIDQYFFSDLKYFEQEFKLTEISQNSLGSKKVKIKLNVFFMPPS